jgi:hypothetical protein
MAWSALEKALAIAVGIDLAAPGTNRKVVTAVARQIGRSAVTTAPHAGAVGRAALTGLAGAAYRKPALAAGILGTAAYQGGYLDPAIQRAQEESFRSQENLRRLAMESDVQRAYEMAGRPTFGEAAQQIVSVPKKRSASKFNRAMKAGMSAVRKSKSNGKPGKLSKPKATFGRVAKVYKALKSGRKVSKKGETGVIQRNIKRYIG